MKDNGKMTTQVAIVNIEAQGFHFDSEWVEQGKYKRGVDIPEDVSIKRLEAIEYINANKN